VTASADRRTADHAERAARFRLEQEKKQEDDAIRDDGESGEQSEIATKLTGVTGSPKETQAGLPFQISDLGNARRLVSRHGKRFRYLCDRRKWLYWDGRRWADDDLGEIKRAAKETVEAIFEESLSEPDDRRRNDLRKFAIRSQSAQRLAGMIELAQSELPMPMRSTDFDRDSWSFNVLNGTLNLKTGTLRKHDPENFISKLAPVEFKPEATCPTWDAFLARIMPSGSLRGFLRRAAGYTLTGDVTEQCILVNHGGGSNGKSTFLNALRGVFGDGEYAMHTPIDTLLAKRDAGGPTNDLARLRGARFVSAVEGDQGRRLAESRVKQLTGGDPVAARYLFAEFFEYVPTYKLWLGVNHKPRIGGTDFAIWRRIRLVPFTTTIPENERDPRMLEKLLEERSGILNWCVAGALDWQAKGLAAPEEVKRATEEYRTEEDTLAPFFEECCKEDADAWTPFGNIYHAYAEWVRRVGDEKPWSMRAFAAALDDRGFECDRKKKTRPRHGIRLTFREPER
jgi:putative DNA primase/helicase